MERAKAKLILTLFICGWGYLHSNLYFGQSNLQKIYISKIALIEFPIKDINIIYENTINIHIE